MRPIPTLSLMITLTTLACGDPATALTDEPEAGDGDDTSDDDGGDDGGGDGGADGGEDGGADDGGTATAPCDAEMSAPLWAMEGDAIHVELHCSDAPDSAYQPELVSAPGDGRFDTDTWTFSWTPGPSDAGRHSLSVAFQPLEGGLPEVSEFDIDVADNPDIAGAVNVVAAEYTHEWGLPVVHIDGTSSIGQSYTDATITWNGDAYPAQIKVRGAASASYPKNSFTLRFEDEEIDLDDQGFDGKRDRLVLITTFDDATYVRQKLIYDAWEEMSDRSGDHRLTPRTFFTVAYKDGAYFGLFIGADHVDDEFASHMGLSKDGNMYKAVSHDANFYLHSASGSAKYDLAQGYEKKEGADLSDFDDLRALVSFTGNASTSEFEDQAGDWLDEREFMDWWLLVHTTASGDSGGKNCYLYNDPEEPGWRYVPWDFNDSFGQDWMTLRRPIDYSNNFRSNNGVFNHIFESDPLNAELFERWDDYRAHGPLNADWLMDRVEEYDATLGPAVDRDWAKWGRQHQSYGGWVAYRDDDMTDAESEREYLEDWIEGRWDTLDDWYGAP